jgi:phospholipase/carboxylesterase
MSLQSIELHPGTAPRATVIILHGLGADGTDFLPMADEFKIDAVGPVRYVFPRAPVQPVTINGGYSMRAWYDIYGADDLAQSANPNKTRREDDAGLRTSIALVHGLIDRELALGVAAHRIVLAGFSQGCAITLAAGLRYSHKLAGLAGLSGYMPLAASTGAERHSANHLTPVFLAHGTNDGVVPLGRGEAARDQMQAWGQPLQWQAYPMEHSVCMEEAQALQAWLLKVLA